MSGRDFSNDELLAILDQLPDLLLVFDENGKYLHVFGPEKLLYIDRLWLVGKTLREVFPAAQADFFMEKISAALAQGATISFEYDLDMDGARKNFHAVALPLEQTAASVSKVVVIARDVTAIRAAEEKLRAREMTAIRLDRLRSLGEMASSLAHEFNQPLSGIRGFAENLLISLENKWDVSEAEIRYKMRRIMEQADRISVLIEHVQDFSRAAGKTDCMKVDLVRVVENSVSMVRAQFRSRGIALKLETSGVHTNVYANPFALEEALLNLLSNARDAFDPVADWRPPDDRWISVGVATLDDGRAAFFVADNGRGMTPAVLDRAGEPFFTTRSPVGGTGLGLTVCRKIAADYGGDLILESVPGEGTKAVMALPPYPEERRT